MGSGVRADFNSGSDGSDGEFNPTSNIEIDLDLAATGTWDTPSPVPGQGVYDPQQWAVVFKYSTINIPAGVTVTFKNHRSGAPVVWLAQGDVTITGIVSLDGENGYQTGEQPRYSEPGPGGFSGAMLRNAGGFGPRGANGTNGTYPSDNQNLLPLIGGSGGGTSNPYLAGGGAGGGAILIASSELIEVIANGKISAIGGQSQLYGAGSGGAIRLVAPTIQGSGQLITNSGRVRIEADHDFFTGYSAPQYIYGLPTTAMAPPTVPQLKVMLVNGIPVPEDPEQGILSSDVELDEGAPVTLQIQALNVPPGTIARVRVTPEQGNIVEWPSTPFVDAGNGTLSATAVITLPPVPSEVQVVANW